MSNYPCLLVKGNMTLAWSTGAGTLLYELDLSGGVFNFNPPGTPYPYPSGTSNLTAVDSYPSVIDGLVYVSGKVIGSTSFPAVDQLIVGGTYDPVKDSVTFSYKGNYLASPPPGFRGGGSLIAVPASWRWQPVP